MSLLLSKWSNVIMVALFTAVVALGIVVYVQSVKHHADQSDLKLKETQLQVSNSTITDLMGAIKNIQAEELAKSQNDLAQQAQTKQIIKAVQAKNGKIDNVISDLNKNAGKKNADGSTPKDIADAWKSL